MTEYVGNMGNLKDGDPSLGGSLSPKVLTDVPTRTLPTGVTRHIHALSEDIYNVLDATQTHYADSALAAGYAMRIGGELAKASLKRDGPRQKGRLWASDLGKRCLRQHWYNFNEPQYGSKLNGYTKFKFLYGNLLEEAVLYFAEEAGHTVTHPQYVVEHSVEGWSIRGRIDAIVDGHLIDVKSTSSFGYKRYKDGINANNDSFGYIEQLSFYSGFIDITPTPKPGGFIWIDKQNGHIKYTAVSLLDKGTLEDKARSIIQAMDKTEGDVPKYYAPEPYGKSGNEKLPIGCAYCPFKVQCWRDSCNGKGLRTFFYNQGPIDFTTVKREPNCPEIRKEG